MRKIRRLKVVAGDRRRFPHNAAFTDLEEQALVHLRGVRASIEALKATLALTRRHACAPAENYDPAAMEQFDTIEAQLASIEDDLRWIPGGAYRHTAEEIAHGDG